MTLKDFFIKYPKIAIAFSGGTDSAYLCYMAKKYAKEMTAIYVSTAFQPTFEKEDAIRFCKEYAIPLTILERDVLSQEAVVQNPANRCYYCKKVIFSEIQKKALELGFTCLADGTNASDDADDRPGMKALQEMKVLSPLRICGTSNRSGKVERMPLSGNRAPFGKAPATLLRVPMRRLRILISEKRSSPPAILRSPIMRGYPPKARLPAWSPLARRNQPAQGNRPPQR